MAETSHMGSQEQIIKLVGRNSETTTKRRPFLMSWTDENNDNLSSQEKNLVSLGLRDVENALNKNNKLVKTLQKEQSEYKETLFQAVKAQFRAEMTTLENQKKEDMAVLASKFEQKMTNQAQEKANDFLESIADQLNKTLDLKTKQVNDLNQAIIDTQEELQYLKSEVQTVKTAQKNQKFKEVLQDFMLVLGAIIATFGAILLIFAFSSSLYSFGWHNIWTWETFTPHYQDPMPLKVIAIVFKIVFSIAWFMLGVFIMFLPLMAYQKFLQSLNYKYKGIAGKLNKFFNKQ